MARVGFEPSDHVASALSTPDLTSDNELSLLSACLPMAFPLTRHTYRTNKYHHQMSPLYTPCHTRHYNQPLHLAPTHGPPPTLRRPVHLALFADHLHTTPRTPSPTRYGFGAHVSDNIRKI